MGEELEEGFRKLQVKEKPWPAHILNISGGEERVLAPPRRGGGCSSSQDEYDFLFSFLFSSNYYIFNNNNKKEEGEGEEKSKKKEEEVSRCLILLPRDIQGDIISCLPATSVVRLRSVCRDWLSLSEEEKVRSQHLAHANSSGAHHLLLIHPCYLHHHHHKVYVIEKRSSASAAVVFPLKHLQENIIQLVGSSKGIICFWSQDEKEKSLQLRLYNPILGEGMRVSLPNYSIPLEFLATHYGFAFDEVRSEFKVVRFANIRAMGAQHDELISLVETCSLPLLVMGNNNADIGSPTQPWRTIQSEQQLKGIRFLAGRQSLPLVNGKLHALVMDNLIVRVMAFDIATEEITFFDIFDHPYSCYFSIIGELGEGGPLFVTCYQFVSDGCWYFGSQQLEELWVMKEYGDPKSWTRLLSCTGPASSSKLNTGWRIPCKLTHDSDEILFYNSFHITPHTPTLLSFPTQTMQ